MFRQEKTTRYKIGRLRIILCSFILRRVRHQVKSCSLYSWVVPFIDQCVDEPLILRRSYYWFIGFTVIISAFDGFIHRHGQYINPVFRHGCLIQDLLLRKKEESREKK